MNEAAQERLFKRVKRHFRDWGKRKCSGYVHGIVDQDRGLDPSEDMIAWSGSGDLYALGYLYGYADAHGPDAAHEYWYPFLLEMDYCWWQEE